MNVRSLDTIYEHIYERIWSPFLNTKEFIYAGNNQNIK